ncbi:MAG TPA: zinc-binding dehydrogenase, partial [Candidatus Manganitrophaceae bacterium]|nr:zinc-binding dehydrogenase [Candidatus Manganitrophaceae bacterium]
IRFEDRVTLLGDGKLGLLIAQALKGKCRLVVIGRHRERRDLVEKWGIDFLSDSGTEPLRKLSDVVVDATGSSNGFALAQQIVRPQGTIVLKTTCAGRPRIDLARVVIDEVTVIGSRCGPFKPAMEALAQKKIDVRSLIEEIFPLKKGKEAFIKAAKRGVLKVLLKP